MPSLKDRTVLVIGRGSGIARAITLAVGEAGGRVVAAGRHPEDLAAAYRGLDVGTEPVDVTDEASIAALAGRLPRLDHVVATASARARGGYADLTGPLVGASLEHQGHRAHPAGQAPGRSPAAGRIVPVHVGGDRAQAGPGDAGGGRHQRGRGRGRRGLAVELAPIRVNASPPAPSTPAPTTRSAPTEGGAVRGPVRGRPGPAHRHRRGRRAAALAALTNGFLTGVSLPVDGGEHLV